MAGEDKEYWKQINSRRLTFYPSDYHYKLFIANCDITDSSRTESLSRILSKQFEKMSPDNITKLLDHYNKMSEYKKRYPGESSYVGKRKEK